MRKFDLFSRSSSFFFNDTATTEIYTLSLHDALPIAVVIACPPDRETDRSPRALRCQRSEEHTSELQSPGHLVCRLLLEKKKSRNGRPGRRRTARPAPRFGRVIRGTARDPVCVRPHREPGGCQSAGRISPCFFFNDTATTEIYTLSLHDALPICRRPDQRAFSFKRAKVERQVALARR